MQAVVKGSILRHNLSQNIIYVDAVTKTIVKLAMFGGNNRVATYTRTHAQLQQAFDNNHYTLVNQKQQYVMVTREFGQPVYIAPASVPGIKITDNAAEAEKWNWKDTISCKLAYHIAVTGYKELNFEPYNQ